MSFVHSNSRCVRGDCLSTGFTTQDDDSTLSVDFDAAGPSPSSPAAISVGPPPGLGDTAGAVAADSHSSDATPDDASASAPASAQATDLNDALSGDAGDDDNSGVSDRDDDANSDANGNEDDGAAAAVAVTTAPPQTPNNEEEEDEEEEEVSSGPTAFSVARQPTSVQLVRCTDSRRK